jgi:Arc/MetJ-type ribon-helix-helix transcriptional regulator
VDGDRLSYVTVSIPVAIADDIDGLIGELGYWPSRGAFVREACIEKIRRERERLREIQGARGDGPVAAGPKAPPGD